MMKRLNYLELNNISGGGGKTIIIVEEHKVPHRESRQASPIEGMLAGAAFTIMGILIFGVSAIAYRLEKK